MLDKGQEDDWFGSRFITALAITAGVCLVSLVIWEWFQEHPVIDIKLYKNFNFLSSNVMMFNLGIMLFGSVVLMPQFLQTQLGYTAELAGLVLSGGGLVLLLEMPIIGQLTTKVQARYLIAFGWLCLALAMFYFTQRIDLFISFASATWLRVIQVIGLGFLFVPITLVAYIGIPPEKTNAVAGLVNFMRNMGSSVGTSLVTTLVARRSQYHQTILVGYTSAGRQQLQNTLEGLTARLSHAGLGIHEAQSQAYARIYRNVQQQATTLAYIDTYMVLCVGAALMFFLSFLLKKNPLGGGGQVAVH
jgi:DHA2 family multidrug resistance protein